MKSLVNISRILVGLLFIFSGFIKLNDPVGFSFKLKDYFAPEVLNLEFLIPYALLIAIVVVIYEVVLGVMILIGYAKKFTLWSLILMIVFFTFLTFYSAYFNKVTDCGCFGDAIPLTPWESFTKDIILLVLILILYFGRKYINPLFSKTTRSLIVLIVFIACLSFGYYVLQHLPAMDFRAYKIGTNIAEDMSYPEDAQKPVYEYSWKFMKDGKEEIVVTSGSYPTVDGEFISVEDKLITEGYEPPIHDFSIERGDDNLTTQFLEEENLLVVVSYSLLNTEVNGYENIREITNRAIKNGYKVIGLSASSTAETEKLIKEHKLNFKYYFCDETALKTIVRSNPSVLELQKGTITQKLHWNDALELQLKKLENATPNLDLNLKRRLDSIAALDQRYRKLMMVDTDEERKALAEEMGLEEADYTGDLWARQIAIDSSNLLFVEQVFAKHGYPGKSLVGEPTNTAAWYVIQHSNKIENYLDLMKEAGKAGELPFRLVAMMEDRYLMYNDEEQIYGTQGMTYDDERGSFIWPIKDPETVNDRRIKAGFTQTIEEYAVDLFGADFEYKVLTLEDVKQ